MTGHKRDGIMIFKAHLFILKNFFKTLKKRKAINKKRYNAVGLYPKWVLFDYHVAGVRKFGDLKF
jgi:hypothetical protein